MDPFILIFYIEPCPRCEERYSARPTPRGAGVQQNPKTASSKRVFPETEVLNDMNEYVVREAPSTKRSRPLAHKAEEQWCESACDRIGPFASCKGATGEGSCKFTFETICSCDVDQMPHYFGKDGTQEHLTPSQECGADNEEVPSLISSCASCFKSLRIAIGRNVRLPAPLRWLFKKRRNAKRTGLESLPFDIRENIFRRLPLKELFLSKILSKSCEELTGSNAFLRLRGASGEGSFTAINFFIRNKEWQCTGLDLQSKTWKRLPTFSCLPKPDATLFKEYSVSGDGGLMCANVSKLPQKEELVVFNLLTGEKRKLPSLRYPRNPVLVKILVDSVTDAYKVIVAGSSSSSGEENLSKRVEVFDSLTSQWEVASDIPGPEYALNEHQTGVFADGMLYFVAFLDGDGQRGIVAFDVKKGEWLKDRNCSVPFSLCSNILQLVESSGNVYLFSEQECGGAVEHCIDVLESSGSNGEVACQLKNVVRVKKSGERGLLVYPEYTCVPYGKGKLCVFNTIKRDGVVYDIQNGVQSEVLEPPPESQRGDNFFSLNPVSFTLQPNFTSKP